MDAIVVFANKLEKLPKKAFPNAVRGTLNSLAFDVKKNTMPRSAKRFVNRDKNFFKANSRVEMARGTNVNSMESIVGFRSLGGTNTAVENLEKQETGGIIPGRSFMPTDAARVSKSKKRKVSRKNRISGIKKIVHVAKTPGKTDGQKFIRSVVEAGKGGHILKENMLFRVDRLSRTGSKWKFRLTAIYSFSKGRSAKIRKATHFMKKATDKTYQKVEKIWIKEAQRQFDRALK